MNCFQRIAAAAAATTITLGTLGLTASAAVAAPSQDGRAAKQVVEAKIDQRLARLAELQGRVDKSHDVTDADRSSLDAILANEVTGLTALRAEVDAATDAQTI